MPRISSALLFFVVVLLSHAAFGQAQPASTPFRANAEASPHAHIDVTQFGAKGDGKNDDKDAIAAASAAGCKLAGMGQGVPEIFFPPGVYRVTQPQAGDSAIFTPACAQQWTGSGYVGAGTQFVNSPSAYINVDNGAHPVDVPVLQLGVKVNGFSTYGLTIQGFKRTLSIVSGANFKFPNTTFSVNASGDNSAGDCPVTVSNAIFVDFTGTRFRTNSATAYGYCFIDTNPKQTVGEITIDSGGIASFGCLIYYQSNVNMNVPTGGWIINNAPTENCGADDIQIANPGKFKVPAVTGLYIANTAAFDQSNFAGALLSSVFALNGIIMDNVFAGQAGRGVAIRVPAGSFIADFHVRCGSGSCVSRVVDSNGNPIGNGDSTNVSGGTDFFSERNSPAPILGNCRSEFSIGTSLFNLPAVRFFQSGKNYATYGADAYCGLMFGSGTGPGFETFIRQPSPGVLGIYFTEAYPPANLTAAPGRPGGTAKAGSYTFNLRSSTSATCSENASAPSVTTTPITIGDGTTIDLKWSAPTYSTEKIAGYCLQPNPGPFVAGSIFIPGATTTSYTYDGSKPAGVTAMAYQNRADALPRFTFTPAGAGSASGNVVGHVQLAAGKTTVKFSPAWNKPPVCMVNDQTTAGAAKAVPTASAVTISGGASDVVDYFCYGNPN